MAYLNKVVDTGLAIISNRIKGVGDEPNHIGWGVGTAEASTSDTTLGSASVEARTEGTSTVTNSGGTTGDTYRVVGVIENTVAAKAITEVALFDAATSGNMFTRSNFAPINVEVGDSVEFDLKITGNN
jgi:hypothetical protein